MKIRIIISFTSIVLLCLFCVAGVNSSDYDSTPVEQDDIKTIDQINDEHSSEYDANTIEQDDIKTIDEINKDTSDVFEATPIEQNDMKTIDQLNN